jgi:hypothetical protein
VRTIFEEPGTIPDDLEWDMASENPNSDMENSLVINSKPDSQFMHHPNQEEEKVPLYKNKHKKFQGEKLTNHEIEIIQEKLPEKDIAVLKSYEGPLIASTTHNGQHTN